MDIAMQVVTKGCVDWGDVGYAAATGAVLGAATGGIGALGRAGAAGAEAAAASVAAARTEFQVADRVAGQLADSRLGSLAGKITPERLQELASNPNALRFLDTASGHTNTIQL